MFGRGSPRPGWRRLPVLLVPAMAIAVAGQFALAGTASVAAAATTAKTAGTA